MDGWILCQTALYLSFHWAVWAMGLSMKHQHRDSLIRWNGLSLKLSSKDLLAVLAVWCNSHGALIVIFRTCDITLVQLFFLLQQPLVLKSFHTHTHTQKTPARLREWQLCKWSQWGWKCLERNLVVFPDKSAPCSCFHDTLQLGEFHLLTQNSAKWRC